MDQILEVSTAFGVAMLTAAIESGRVTDDVRRRVLITSVNSAVPEASPPPAAWPGFARLASHVDHVVSWNDLIHPFHPHSWNARPHDVHVIGRLLRDKWGVGESLELLVESIQVSPADTLTRVFDTARVSVYSDGLMSYGPTRVEVRPGVVRRIDRLIFVDLVPGVAPLLLTESERVAETVPASALRRTIGSLPTPSELDSLATRLDPARGTALVLGQYLSALDLLTVWEEAAVYSEIIRRLQSAGYEQIVYKKHPNSPNDVTRQVVNSAISRQPIHVLETGLAEQAFDSLNPSIVVGCFSTAIATARAVYGLPVARLGTDALLRSLKNPKNSNRIPLVIIDATVPEISPSGALLPSRLPDIALELATRAVSYEMQPGFLNSFEADYARYLQLQRDGSVPEYLVDSGNSPMSTQTSRQMRWRPRFPLRREKRVKPH